jgi:hypothetical protein
MDDFWTVLGIPVILVITSLILEYWIIQPIRSSKGFRRMPRKSQRDWVTATTEAVKRFRKQQPHYSGLLRRSNIKIEEKEVKRGYAVVRIAVFENRFFWENLISSSRVEERFELTIDRTGDVLDVKTLPVAEDALGELENSEGQTAIQSDNNRRHPNPYIAYLYVLIGLLGGAGGLVPGALVYHAIVSDPHPEDDVFFWVLSVIAVIGGVVVAIWVDIFFQMDQAYAWQRLPLAAILGIIGGAVGIIGVIILLIWLMIQSESKSMNAQSVGKNPRKSGTSRY